MLRAAETMETGGVVEIVGGGFSAWIPRFGSHEVGGELQRVCGHDLGDVDDIDGDIGDNGDCKEQERGDGEQ